MATDDKLHRQIGERLHRIDQLYTRSRRTIVDALYDFGSPVTIPELLQRAPSLTQSSAYRNLAMMESAGIVRRLVRNADHARYELAEDLTGHHHHVICTSCGMIRDFTLDARLERSLDSAFTAAARDAGLRPRHHDIEIYGTCANCEAEDARSS
jgi:Fe2+ or Zn2+ uptake regulation protein